MYLFLFQKSSVHSSLLCVHFGLLNKTGSRSTVLNLFMWKYVFIKVKGRPALERGSPTFLLPWWGGLLPVYWDISIICLSQLRAYNSTTIVKNKECNKVYRQY